MAVTFIKDPSAVLDYKINWETWLDADMIATSTWTVPAGITKLIDINTTTTATIWLSGGTDGTDYELVNKIVTSAGRTDERTIIIRVKNR